MRRVKPDREGRFRALFEDAYDDVLRFALRRVNPAQAEDVVADAFLVAWRRFDEVPGRHDDRRAWLFGIARHCLLNARRGQARHEALAVRVAEVTRHAGAADGLDADLVAQRVDVAAAWRQLSAADQEVLSLAVFDDLRSPQAASVLGISATSYRLRLLRARRALRRRLNPTGSPSTARPATPLEAQS